MEDGGSGSGVREKYQDIRVISEVQLRPVYQLDVGVKEKEIWMIHRFLIWAARAHGGIVQFNQYLLIGSTETDE